jgi:tetratricopeptide (TPR) repeat protein
LKRWFEKMAVKDAVAMNRFIFFICILFFIGGCAMNSTTSTSGASNDVGALISSLWDFNDKVASEQRFREALKTASGEDALEIETQIVRTFSLRKDFTTAHSMLDEIEKKMGAKSRPDLRVRYLLERGRSFNSAGQFETAKPLFVEAYELALKHERIGLAIDAAHMFGFAKDQNVAFEWTQKAMQLALSSEHPDAIGWRPGLANNLGSTERARGNLDAAMKHFQLALEAHKARSKPPQIFIAHWQVANVHRLQGRVAEALEIQRRLLAEMIKENTIDAYVYDELAELYAASGDHDKAAFYAAASLKLAEKDAWVLKNEQRRVERLRELAQMSKTK